LSSPKYCLAGGKPHENRIFRIFKKIIKSLIFPTGNHTVCGGGIAATYEGFLNAPSFDNTSIVPENFVAGSDCGSAAGRRERRGKREGKEREKRGKREGSEREGSERGSEREGKEREREGTERVKKERREGKEGKEGEPRQPTRAS
jgi:hypothetical protein